MKRFVPGRRACTAGLLTLMFLAAWFFVLARPWDPTIAIMRRDFPPGAESYVLGPITDLNSDGTLEVVLGYPGALFGGAGRGSVTLLSGKGGEPIWEVGGTDVGGRFGRRIWKFDDDDRDGWADLIVESGPVGGERGRIVLISGRTGAVLRDLSSVAGGGHAGSPVLSSLRGALLPVSDLDGDGRWDLYCVQVYGDGGFRVALYSGWTLEEIRHFDGYSRVWMGGDLDGDGVQDVVFSSDVQGELHGRSGHDGEVVLRVPGQWIEACSAGDVDGDGAGDLFLLERPRDSFPYVALWRSGTGDLGPRLLQEMKVIQSGFGHLIPVQDMDCDGLPELLISEIGHDGCAYAVNNNYGKVYLFSPRQGRVLWSMMGQWRFCRMDHAGAFDVDGDGVPDIVLESRHPGEMFSEFRFVSGGRIGLGCD